MLDHHTLMAEILQTDYWWYILVRFLANPREWGTPPALNVDYMY
jgi:hypothetical protein